MVKIPERPPMKTSYRKQKEARDKAVHALYTQLISQPGAMKTAVEQAVMRKFKIHARSTIWEICQRVERNQTTA